MRFSADLGPDAVEGSNVTTAISPDGTRLAFVARGPAGKEQLATRLLAQPKATYSPTLRTLSIRSSRPTGSGSGSSRMER